MREIKFRAWDSNLDIMLGNDQVLDESIFESHHEETGVTILQFTGLLDKHGKEIYEGDIVKSFDEILTVFFNKHTAAFEVMYDYPKGDCEAIGVNEHNSLEIIGNIYENPDLLK